MQIKIALADDHHLVRSGIKMLLDHFSEFKVILEAAHGMELIEKLSHAKVLPQICMVDITMPFMDGFECTRQLNALYPEIKVVALSVHDDLKSVNNMIEA